MEDYGVGNNNVLGSKFSRYYLGYRNPVNRIVAQSLRQNPEKFCYLNLGIDAVCEETEIEESLEDLLGQKTWSLVVRNFQIINGCQTAKTISEVDPAPQAFVVIRLIELGRGDKDRRDKFVPEISVAKNRQSAIHGRDLFAWDRDQVRLKREFKELGIFFETREKEWNALSKMKKATMKKLYPKGMLENTLAAKAYLSIFLQDPFRAKQKKREFFQHEKEGGAFELIFSDTPAEQMLLAANIYQYVDEKRKEAGRKARSLTKEAHTRVLSDEENFQLEEAKVVQNGDTYLSSIIGLILSRYYNQNLLKDKNNLILTRHLLKQIPSSKSQKAIEPLYDIARETIYLCK